MKDLEIISHMGKNIMVVNLSNATSEQIVVALRDAKRKISKMTANSTLLLTDGTKASYNPESGAAMKEFAEKNTPYLKASAVVGGEGAKSVLQNTVAMKNRREIVSFPTKAEAMDWLAAQ